MSVDMTDRTATATLTSTVTDPATDPATGPPPVLLEQVYDALRDLARRRLALERAGHTLQATALVHEVYLRLAEQSADRWNDPAHFYHAAAEAMRRVLIDHARTRGRAKRGGGAKRVPLSAAANVAVLADGADPDDVLALDAAVGRLDAWDPAAAAVVRLRFYAGLGVEQTAAVLGCAPSTVKRQWTYARAWLYRELSADDERV